MIFSYFRADSTVLSGCSMQCRKVDVVESFLEIGWNVLPNRCWEWNGRTTEDGYGLVHRQKLTHRVSWSYFKGPIPEGIKVLHTCDNPSCVNPDHLFLGTIGDNNKDRSMKGRTRTSLGEKRPLAKLTVAAVAEIRSWPQYRGAGKELADKYGVSQALISWVRNGRGWQNAN